MTPVHFAATYIQMPECTQWKKIEQTENGRKIVDLIPNDAMDTEISSNNGTAPVALKVTSHPNEVEETWKATPNADEVELTTWQAQPVILTGQEANEWQALSDSRPQRSDALRAWAQPAYKITHWLKGMVEATVDELLTPAATDTRAL